MGRGKRSGRGIVAEGGEGEDGDGRKNKGGEGGGGCVFGGE